MRSGHLDTLKGAIALIAETIGADELARKVGRTNWLIYRWADEASDSLPNVEQARALDAAYYEVKGCLPIAMVMARHEGSMNGGCVLAMTLDACASMGEVANTIHDALEDDIVTLAEAADCKRAIHALREDMARIEGELNRRCTPPELKEVI